MAIEKLGPVVTVSMPTYNFHGSLWKYQIIGQRGTHTLATGNKVLLYWVIIGSSGEGAYRYIRCTVGKPGS